MVSIFKKAISVLLVVLLSINQLIFVPAVFADQTSTQSATLTSPSPDPSLTPSPTPTPTVTPTPEPTIIPSPSATTAAALGDSTSSAVLSSPTPTPTDPIAPSETPSPTPTATDTLVQNSFINQTPSPTPNPSPSPTPAASMPINTVWTTNSDSVTTTNSVVLNVPYVAPQNSNVSVTFTKLPANPGKLTIKEITLTADQIAKTGALSDKAYDMSSDMPDGTFAYTLSLPVPQNDQSVTRNVNIKYAENLDKLSSAQTIDQQKQQTSNSVTVSDINHFTIFVVAGVSESVCIGAGANCFQTIQAAINAASPGDTITLYTDLTISSQINVASSITIDGNGHTIHASFAKTSNSNNSAIEITNSNVTVKNLTIDGTGGHAYPSQLHGINIYQSTGINLSTVNILNFGGSGVVVNGSTVTATNLNTSGNSWDGVNVDPGLGVITPSVFTLNSGILAEPIQIKSDGTYVSGSATVTVTASGYNMYKVGGTSATFVWTNRALTNAATITRSGITTLYTAIQSAVNAAISGDTINVAAGTYNEQVVVNTSLTLQGAGDTTIIQPSAPSKLTSLYTLGAGTWGGNKLASIIEVNNVGASGVTIKNLKVDGVNISSAPAGANYNVGISYGETGGVIDSVSVVNMNTGTGSPRTYGIWLDSVNTGVSAEVKNSTVNNYNKNGINARGTNLTVNIHNDAVSGPGAISTEVPNGILLIDSAKGNVSNNTIHENVYSGSTYKGSGVLLYSAANGIMVTNNTIYNSDEAVLINNTNSAAIFGNTLRNDLVGVHLKVGAANNVVSNNNILNNTYGVRLDGPGEIDYSSGDDAGTGNNAHNNTFTGNTENVRNWITDTFNATNNDWGVYTDSAISATINGNVTFDPFIGATTAVLAPTVTLDPTKTIVKVNNTTSASTINIPSNVTNPTLDVSGITTSSGGNTNATINGDITLNATTSVGTIAVAIPAGITISGASANWTGVINAPTLVNPNNVPLPPAPSGQSNTVGTLVEVGFGNVPLTFNKGVRIILAGQAGKLAGYVRNGAFTAITNTCSSDSQATGDALAGGECKIDVGSDMVIWTQHFTQFVSYSQNAQSSGGGTSSNGGGFVSDGLGCGSHDCNTARFQAPQAQTLGASTGLASLGSAFVPSAAEILGTSTGEKIQKGEVKGTQTLAPVATQKPAANNSLNGGLIGAIASFFGAIFSFILRLFGR